MWRHTEVIEEQPGRASIKTTLDTYGHLVEGSSTPPLDALDDSRAFLMLTRRPAEVTQLPTR